MRRAVQGFTLVEMLVGLGLTVFFMLMTLPSASAYLTDARIRAAAQTYYSGAQLARAEAVRRNAEVRLLLTDDPRASQPTASVNGLGWVMLAGGGPQGVDWSTLEGTEWVDSKDPQEARTTGLRVAANEAVVQFDGQGAASVNQIVKFLGPAADTCYPRGPRCLHVVISLGGQVRLCDPGISNNGDNRKC